MMPGSTLEIDNAECEILEVDAEFAGSSPSRPSDAVRFVTFFFGDDLYGLAAQEVAEVTHPLPVSRLPHCPEFLSGIAPLRGEVVAVVDLRQMLGVKTLRSSGREKLVMLTSSEHQTQPAFKVERMHELVSFSPSEITLDDVSRPAVMGTANIDGRRVTIVRPEAVRAALHS